MARYKVQEGVSSLGVEEETFNVAEDGTVEVPDSFVARLIEAGVTLTPLPEPEGPEADAAKKRAAAEAAKAAKAAAEAAAKAAAEAAKQANNGGQQ